MNRQTAVAAALAILLVAAGVGGILWSTRKNRVELTGAVLKVRSQPIDPGQTIVLLDVRLHNPSTQPFVVKTVEAFVDEADGTSTAAEIFSESDVDRALDFYKAMGPRYTAGLTPGMRLNSEGDADRTVTVTFPISWERISKRRQVRVIVHDVDGAASSIAERR